MRVVAWGTYDLGKPRTRILLRGLRERGVEVVPCHREVWGGVDDKSQVVGALARLRLALAWLFAYPVLVLSYLRLPRHDAVFVGYLGQLDVLVLWPWARLRRVPVVWDAFLSLTSTVVEDRRLLSPRHPLAWLLHAWEWLACRAADRVVLDTRAHAELFARLYRLAPERLAVAWVGVEPERFRPAGRDRDAPEAAHAGAPETAPETLDGVTPEPSPGVRRVLFYGQLIPLHGIETILEAARRFAERDQAGAGDGPVEWVVIGDGQERWRLEEAPCGQTDAAGAVRWVRWVPYDRLGRWVAGADLCLGIFGTSDKAARVVPNKAFQVLAAGRALVTRDSPAIRELFEPPASGSPADAGVTLVPAGDPAALAAAVAARLAAGREAEAAWREGRDRLVERIVPRAVAAGLEAALCEAIARRAG